MRRRHSRASSAAVQSFHPPARPAWMCGTGPAGTVEDHCARLLSARVQWLDLPAALGYSPGGEALIDETGAHELATMRCRAMLWRTL